MANRTVKPKVYLAGPEVLYPDARLWSAELCRLSAANGWVGGPSLRERMAGVAIECLKRHDGDEKNRPLSKSH
jgi:nucleoside 2-deoxyribosyltransferase